MTVGIDFHRIYRYCAGAVLGLLGTVVLSCGDDIAPNVCNPDSPDTTTQPISDSTLPQSVTDPRLTYSLPDGRAYLEWTAPADDSADEPVSRYEVRFSDSPVFLSFWDIGIIHNAPPDPSHPGQTEFLSISAPARGKDLYAGIKAFDEAGNESRIDSIATVHIPGYNLMGQCLDAFSHQPIQGLEVKVTANYIRTLTTDAEGRFSSNDLTAGASMVSINTGLCPVDYHPQGKTFVLRNNINYTYFCIPVRPVESPYFRNLLELFKLMSRTNGTYFSTILTTWKKRPVKCYVPEFTNTYGVDYHAEAVAALQRWTEAAGTELFSFVDAPPDTGIIFGFKSPAEMGGHLGLTHHTYDSDNHPLIDEVEVVNNSASRVAIYYILLHEIGHTIQFGHVPFNTFIMFGSHPLPADISQDEIDVLRLLLALPTRLNLANYDELYP